MVVDIEVTKKLDKKIQKGCGTCEFTLKWAPRSFKFCVVVDIENTDKLGGNSKRGVALRGHGTCEYTLKWA